jgi:hypothetical protein
LNSGEVEGKKRQDRSPHRHIHCIGVEVTQQEQGRAGNRSGGRQLRGKGNDFVQDRLNLVLPLLLELCACNKTCSEMHFREAANPTSPSDA